MNSLPRSTTGNAERTIYSRNFTYKNSLELFADSGTSGNQPMLPGKTANDGVETAPPLRRTAAAISITIEDAPGRGRPSRRLYRPRPHRPGYVRARLRWRVVDPRRHGGRRSRLQWRRVSPRRRRPVAELELAGCIPAAGVGTAAGRARVSGVEAPRRRAMEGEK